LLESYIDLIEGGESEIVEKKSRFIAQVARAATEDEAYAFVERVKKKHYDARHNCFAFSVGGEMPLLRFSDDGEPQGTAGKPILEVITNSGVHNVCIVVTRYFGGTLLGTGGLVRAYTDAAKAGLENSETKLLQRIFPTNIRTSYTDMGKLQYIFNTNNIHIVNTDFTDEVSFKVELPAEVKDKLINEIIDATSSRAVIDVADEIFG
jgi:uncharacterized YigZ family protein